MDVKANIKKQELSFKTEKLRNDIQISKQKERQDLIKAQNETELEDFKNNLKVKDVSK